MSAYDRSLVSKVFGLGMTQFTDRYSPITKRFALRLSGHVQEMANTTRERAVKYLNFSLGKSAHCPSESALQIDLNQGEALFQVGSCSSFRSEPQQSIAWKKKDVSNESNRSLCKKSPLPFVFPTQFPSHLAIVPARLLCPLPNGAGGQSGARRRLCRQQHRGGNFGAL
jgi:hypothetical protein